MPPCAVTMRVTCERMPTRSGPTQCAITFVAIERDAGADARRMRDDAPKRDRDLMVRADMIDE